MMLLEKLAQYFSYPFVRYALVVGVLIALCSSVLGVTLVLRRFSFIGDGLSHVAFGAMAVAAVVGLSNRMLIVLPITVLAAVLLLCVGRNSRLKGDASIAVISVGALAVGYLLMSLFSPSANVSGDVCGTLFGSVAILTLSSFDVWLCVILSVLVLGVFALTYHKIFAVTFDESFAASSGVRVGAYNLLVAVITAVIIVLAMNLVGSLLVSALVVMPAVSAMRVFRNFRSVLIGSAVISVSCAVLGILISVLFSTPVGSSVVAVELAVFLVFWLLGSKRG